jgi:hypothetical protein
VGLALNAKRQSDAVRRSSPTTRAVPLVGAHVAKTRCVSSRLLLPARSLVARWMPPVRLTRHSPLALRGASRRGRRFQKRDASHPCLLPARNLVAQWLPLARLARHSRLRCARGRLRSAPCRGSNGVRVVSSSQWP